MSSLSPGETMDIATSDNVDTKNAVEGSPQHEAAVDDDSIKNLDQQQQQVVIVENPQDATLNKELSNDENDNDHQEESFIATGSIQIEPSLASREQASRQNQQSQTTGSKRKRRRGRTIQITSFQDTLFSPPQQQQQSHEGQPPPLPPLPQNQYTVTLTRRAVKKREENDITITPSRSAIKRETSSGGSTLSSSHSATSSQDEKDDEEYGDISLGMKLIVVGGRLIVQGLNALSDGRASPAQLTGNIQRGDILLSIDSLSLVNLPIDQLLNALKPLSSPDNNGLYKRVLHLRFEAGTGAEMLKSHEAAEAWKNDPKNHKDEAFDAANDMFSLFPMVDQLSGAPLFESHDPEPEQTPVIEQPQEALSDTSSVIEKRQEIVITDELISQALSMYRSQDRERFSSKFFLWNDDLSEWLRKSANNIVVTSSSGAGTGLTQKERVELGKRVIDVFKELSYLLERLDKGKDRRSFKSWTSSLSLRSRASTRRRYVLDTTSLPVKRQRSSSADMSTVESIDERDGSEGTNSDVESLDGVTSDELLLGLAAHDDIWRKQVIDALHEEIRKMDTTEVEEERKEDEQKEEDIGSAISKELGSFLFGHSISKIVSEKKRPLALPPGEITAVLFDLTTYIATSTPDEISIHGRGATGSTLQSFGSSKKRKESFSDDVILATRFLLEQILPIWLESFRPLQIEQRRLLWPRARAPMFGSPGASTIMSDDSLTVGSLGSVMTPGGAPGRKNLQERIEEQELDQETRAETCFLVTYFFVHKILRACSKFDGKIPEEEDEEHARSFVNTYGAYLQMHTCFARAASFHAVAVFDELLKAAKHDPVHRDSVKEIQKTKSLNFYEPAKLSAVVEYLTTVRYEMNEKRRDVILDLCVSAYPDIQPWQVRSACMEKTADRNERLRETCELAVLHEFYFRYLCLLLHPSEGHSHARRESTLVKEWCEWSVGILPLSRAPGEEEKLDERKQHFLTVASKSAGCYLPYRRDLVMLLNLSMHIGDHNLSLDLVDEILDSSKLQSQPDTVRRLVECLREISVDTLDENRVSTDHIDLRLVGRALRLFDKMSRSTSENCRQSVVVGDELQTLLKHWVSDELVAGDGNRAILLIDFFIQESGPADVLSSLASWSRERHMGPSMYPRLNDILSKGVLDALDYELSGSLLRLKHARQEFKEQEQPPSPQASDGSSIWSRMGTGMLSIDK